MSTDEQDAILGRALRERKTKREDLHLLDVKIDRLAMALATLQQHVAQKIYRGDLDYAYPQRDEIGALFTERKQLQDELDAAEKVLAGYLP